MLSASWYSEHSGTAVPMPSRCWVPDRERQWRPATTPEIAGRAFVRNVLSACEVLSAAWAPTVCATSNAVSETDLTTHVRLRNGWRRTAPCSLPIFFRDSPSARYHFVSADVREYRTSVIWQARPSARGSSTHRRRITMGHRVFTDSHGTEWQAWDVVPQPRIAASWSAACGVPVAHADRRRDPERRIIGGRRPMLSAVSTAGGCARGWR
jgi:hypothetical protein